MGAPPARVASGYPVRGGWAGKHRRKDDEPQQWLIRWELSRSAAQIVNVPAPVPRKRGWGKGIGTGAVRMFGPIAIGAR